MPPPPRQGFKQKRGLAVNDIVDVDTFAFLCAGRTLLAVTSAPGRSSEIQDGAWSEFEEEYETRPAGTVSSVRAARIPARRSDFRQSLRRTNARRAPRCVMATRRPASACWCFPTNVNSRANRRLAICATFHGITGGGASEPLAPGAGSFAAADLTVRSDSGNGTIAVPGRTDTFGEHIRFGANAQGQHGIVALLAGRVREFYRKAGLAYLHEIRLSEAATARLKDDQYHLFWNNEQAGEAAASDEMRLLLDRFVRPERSGRFSPKDRDFLLAEYTYDRYGGLHLLLQPVRRQARVPAEILHPLFINRHRDPALSIGHVTDTHVDVRADVYEHNLRAAKAKGQFKNKADYNNFNRSFSAVDEHAQRDSDVLLLTGT